jgi:MarR family transcriptional regulator, lower aerobic nicotinate degradation pathway regulator
MDALAQLSFLIYGTLAEVASEHDLSVIQTRLLGVLRDREPTMQELGRFLGLDKSSVSGLVDRAERRGLVRRAPSTQDRRAVRVTLTDDGRALGGQVALAFGSRVEAYVVDLPTAEREQLTRLATRVVAGDARRRALPE